MADKKIPEPVKKYYELDKKRKTMLEETAMMHADAYKKTYDELLKKKGKDTDELEKEDVAKMFAEKMSDYYIDGIKERLGITDKKKATDMDYALLMETYAGTTKEHLLNTLKSAGKDYTFRGHMELKNEHLKKLDQSLTGVVQSIIRDEHVKDIVKHINPPFIDADLARREEAIKLLQEWNNGEGTPQPHQYKLSPAYKKDKKK